MVAAFASAAAAMLIMLLAVLAVSRRRRRPPAAPEDPVAVALDESIGDLRRERDIRRAIIACYARMERALAAAGTARKPSETPLEFLARVLERVAREPANALTELFERAKFSVEPMGDPEKERAIAALEALRAQVAA